MSSYYHEELQYFVEDEIPSISTPVSCGEQTAGLACPVFVLKTWGYELIHYNNQYCMKVLHFTGGEDTTSMHLHVHKHETLLVTKGELFIECFVNKQVQTYILKVGRAFVVCPGFAHRLYAKVETDVVEASTYDHPSDSIRLF